MIVMMQITSRSLPVSTSVLLFIHTFELQSESRAQMFHISGYLCTFDFGVFETANLENAHQYFFIFTT